MWNALVKCGMKNCLEEQVLVVESRCWLVTRPKVLVMGLKYQMQIRTLKIRFFSCLANMAEVTPLTYRKRKKKKCQAMHKTLEPLCLTWTSTTSQPAGQRTTHGLSWIFGTRRAARASEHTTDCWRPHRVRVCSTEY